MLRTKIANNGQASLTTLGLIAAAVIFQLLIGRVGSAQQVGDRVVVTANFETRIYDKAVDQVVEGSLHTIEETNGKWCRLDQVKGWLPLRNVMSLRAAVEYYSQRIKANPNDYIALANRGMIYNDLEQYPAAFTDLDRCLALNKRNAAVWLNRAVVLKNQNKLKLAAADLNQALELQPELANAHFNMGMVLYELQNFDESLRAMNKAIELDDSRALWVVSRGMVKLESGDVDGAKEDYQLALRVQPRLSDAYVGLSNISLAKGDLEAAFKAADTAVKLQPRNAMALNSRGLTQYRLGNVEQALKDLNLAVRFAPRLSIAFGNRGICHVYLNNFDQAIADHTRELKLKPENALAYSNRAVAWFGKGEFRKARDDYRKAVKLAPELDEALNGYAWFLATCPEKRFRNGKLAIEKAKQACELSEYSNWYYLDTLAAAYAERGDFETAVKYARQAVDVAPEDKKELCRKQVRRFESQQPFRSQVGKNVEQNLSGS